MLTELNEIRGGLPTTRLMWDGEEVIRLMHRGEFIAVLRMGLKERMLKRVDILGEALVAWFEAHNLDVRTELRDGLLWIVHGPNPIPIDNVDDDFRIDPRRNVWRLEGDELTKGGFYAGESGTPAPVAKANPVEVAPAPPARVSASHTRALFKVPPVRGRYYPVYGARFDVEGNTVVVRFQDEALVTLAPRRTEIAAICFDRRKGDRLEHLAEALRLGFSVDRSGAFPLISPLPGFIASTPDGDIASEGEWLALTRDVTVEACAA